MWTPPENMHRRDLHLEDWNDDGVCDIIYSDPDTGAVRVFINEYVEKKTWDGAFREVPVDGLSCEHRSGIGLHDCEFYTFPSSPISKYLTRSRF